MTKKEVEIKNNTAQLHFIGRVKEVVPPNHSFVDELADLLQVSNDSAYRRIRGETALSIDEVVTLCNHYKISFDSFSKQNRGSVTFNCNSLDNQESSLQNYLSGILNDLRKIQSFDQKEIIYAAEDIPIFHNFAFPELTAFKLFYWNRSMLNVSSVENSKFDFSAINNDFVSMVKQIYETYIEIPSVEIWTEETVSSLIKQIQFYWDSGLFKNKADALLVVEQIGLMLQQIEKQAAASSKKSENNFTLYNSELMIGNNTILVTMNTVKASYLSYHSFNSMITTNLNFCNETEGWLKNLIKKSTLLSGVSEKQRYQFFNKKQEIVKKLKEHISK